jgi:(1->4)-alpha-D-glucan 1-alpha-D-glucosylmutase
LWDLSLVDPDNRRPLDYELRRRMLEEVETAIARDRHAAMLGMLEGWRDGRAKLTLTAELLAYRRDKPVFFAEGGYEPLTATGTKAAQICAFFRSHGDDRLLVVTSRFPVQLEINRGWRDLLTGRRFRTDGAALTAEEALADLPVAVLVPDAESRA